MKVVVKDETPPKRLWLTASYSQENGNGDKGGVDGHDHQGYLGVLPQPQTRGGLE
jgi:hypothetical protein